MSAVSVIQSIIERREREDGCLTIFIIIFHSWMHKHINHKWLTDIMQKQVAKNLEIMDRLYKLPGIEHIDITSYTDH